MTYGQRVLRRSVVIAAILGLIVVFKPGARDDDKPVRTEQAPPPDMRSVRCRRAPKALVQAIESGLTVTGGGGLRRGWMVRSRDFEKVYFVAAVIADATGAKQGIGLWATDRGYREYGTIFAVNGFANEFSDWGDGGKTDAQFSQFDDGATEAESCAS